MFAEHNILGAGLYEQVEGNQMPRYYFHIRNVDDVALDEEGTDLPDLTTARRQALASARELLANAIKEGKEPISESVVIADANGQELMSVPLTQALPNRFRD
jgi:hypothetical protein